MHFTELFAVINLSSCLINMFENELANTKPPESYTPYLIRKYLKELECQNFLFYEITTEIYSSKILSCGENH